MSELSKEPIVTLVLYLTINNIDGFILWVSDLLDVLCRNYTLISTFSFSIGFTKLYNEVSLGVNSRGNINLL